MQNSCYLSIQTERNGSLRLNVESAKRFSIIQHRINSYWEGERREFNIQDVTVGLYVKFQDQTIASVASVKVDISDLNDVFAVFGIDHPPISIDGCSVVSLNILNKIDFLDMK